MEESSKTRTTLGTTPDLLESTIASMERFNPGYTKVNVRYAEVVNVNQADAAFHSCNHLSSDSDLILSIKESLTYRYKRRDACMLSFLWDDNGLDYPLEGYCVDLKVEEKDLMGTFAEGNIIPLNKILFSEDQFGRRSKRQILISGDAGYGKTTTAKRLSYDWATLDSPSYISHFDLVVNIPLIATGEQTLEESIRNYLSVDERNYRTIISKKLQWLIILDGFDEASRPDLALSFLRDSIQECYANSTVIVTSRPYAIKNLRNLFDRRLCILGVSKDNKRKYIKAVFSPNIDKEAAMIREIENDAFLCKASECPLLLHMIACVYGVQYDKGTSSITSRTTLYLELLSLLRIRYIKKFGETGMIKEKNIIDDHLFIKLGKVAGRHIRSFNLVTEEVLREEFAEEEEYNVVLRLGILLGLPTRVNMRVIIKYEFFHRTFAEFLEAVYIVHLAKGTSENLFGALPTSDDLGTAMFVAGLLGKKFIKNKSILLWISGNRRTLSELAEIKTEANLDINSWELVCSLIKRIEYHNSLVERNLLYSGYSLTNFRVIEIKTGIINEEFWMCVNKMIKESNSRTEFSIELPVSVVELTSFESNVKIRFIDMENIMSELMHVSNLLFRNANRFFARVRIHPADISCITEDCGIINRTLTLKKPVGLLANSFCPVPECLLHSAGGQWRFGKIKIVYGQKFGIINVEQNEQEFVTIIPILVITKVQYCCIRKESPLDHDSLRVVDFKDFPMCRTVDDLRTPQYLGHADTIDVFERLRRRRIDLYHIHEWSCDHELVNSLEMTSPSRRRKHCIII